MLWKGRLIIPRKLRHVVLNILHEGHPGIVSMRSYARFHVWWPKMDSEIEQFVHCCKECQKHKNKEPELPLFSWTVPQIPWSRIHIDYAGPYDGHYWLVVVDATTKWLEVYPTAKVTSEKTVAMLEDMFSRLGLPKIIVSDNGSQFTSSTFKHFCNINNIRHITTAPYHPRSNGLAERYVQTFKKRYAASKADGSSLSKRLQTFLFKYRTTPHQTTGKSPAEMLYGRQLRCKLSILKPNVTDNIDEALVRQKKNHDLHTRWREFSPGEPVWVKHKGDKFREGVVLRRTGPVSYIIEEEGKECRRHADHLRKRHRKTSNSNRTSLSGGEM
jgi:transposase InsO family protein